MRTREAAGGAESEWWRDCDAGIVSACRGTGFSPPPHRSPPQILEKKKPESPLKFEFRKKVNVSLRMKDKEISVNKAPDDVC